MQRRIFQYLLFLFVAAALTSPISESTKRKSNPPLGDHLLETVYQFPNETWIENLAIRPNGNLLITLISKPEVWEVDVASRTASLVHRFDGVMSNLGIVEYEHDTFSVIVGSWNDTTFKAEAGSFGIWSLNMSSKGDRIDKATPVHKIADIPGAKFLNGLAVPPTRPDILLAGDSGAGVIYSVNTKTGAYKVAIDNPVLQSNQSVPYVLGVNGVQFRPNDPDHVYITNSNNRPTFAKIPIFNSGEARGPAEAIVNQVPYAINEGAAADDFTFDARGAYAWITTDPSQTLARVEMDSGTVEVIAGGASSNVLPGPTACHFGRTREDLKVGRLYITTNGGIPFPPSGGIHGGRVLSLATKKI